MNDATKHGLLGGLIAALILMGALTFSPLYQKGSTNGDSKTSLTKVNTMTIRSSGRNTGIIEVHEFKGTDMDCIVLVSILIPQGAGYTNLHCTPR